MNTPYRYIRWFNDLGMADVPLVGGKNASLGEMYRELAAEGVRVPNGFAITAEAYRHVLGRCVIHVPTVSRPAGRGHPARCARAPTPLGTRTRTSARRSGRSRATCRRHCASHRSQ